MEQPHTRMYQTSLPSIKGRVLQCHVHRQARHSTCSEEWIALKRKSTRVLEFSRPHTPCTLHNFALQCSSTATLIATLTDDACCTCISLYDLTIFAYIALKYAQHVGLLGVVDGCGRQKCTFIAHIKHIKAERRYFFTVSNSLRAFTNTTETLMPESPVQQFS